MRVSELRRGPGRRSGASSTWPGFAGPRFLCAGRGGQEAQRPRPVHGLRVQPCPAEPARCSSDATDSRRFLPPI